MEKNPLVTEIARALYRVDRCSIRLGEVESSKRYMDLYKAYDQEAKIMTSILNANLEPYVSTTNFVIDSSIVIPSDGTYLGDRDLAYHSFIEMCGKKIECPADGLTTQQFSDAYSAALSEAISAGEITQETIKGVTPEAVYTESGKFVLDNYQAMKDGKSNAIH